MTEYHKDRISIQVGLSGYSFKIETDDTVRSSEWLSADRIFTSSEFQRRYDQVDVSVFTPKCSLVPRQFHHPGESRQLLSGVSPVTESDYVEYVDVPQFASVLVFSNSIGESLSRVISDMVLKTDGDKARLFLNCIICLWHWNRSRTITRYWHPTRMDIFIWLSLRDVLCFCAMPFRLRTLRQLSISYSMR